MEQWIFQAGRNHYSHPTNWRGTGSIRKYQAQVGISLLHDEHGEQPAKCEHQTRHLQTKLHNMCAGVQDGIKSGLTLQRSLDNV